MRQTRIWDRNLLNRLDTKELSRFGRVCLSNPFSAREMAANDRSEGTVSTLLKLPEDVQKTSLVGLHRGSAFLAKSCQDELSS
jgi:hypothetical protein